MERLRFVFGLLALMSLFPLGSCYGQVAGPDDPVLSEMPAPVREQIERLHSFDPVERRHAAQELGKMGERAAPAVPSLIGALSDSARVVVPSRGGETSSSSVAEASMMALVQIGAPAVDPLISSLQNPNPGVRMMAAAALGKIEDSRTVDPLVQVLEGDGDYLVQAAAVDSLRKKKDPRALEAFLLAEKSESWVVRSLARRAVEEARTDQGDEGRSSPGEAVPSEEPQPVQRAMGEGVDASKGDEGGTAETSPTQESADTALSEAEGSRTETAPELTHIVEQGDTLYSLGRRYGVPWQTLMAYNDLRDPTSLHAGQILKVRVGDGAAGVVAGKGETLYKVQEGDNLYEIGLLFRMSWTRIAERNGLTEPDQIFVGQVLEIPGKVQAPSP